MSLCLKSPFNFTKISQNVRIKSKFCIFLHDASFLIPEKKFYEKHLSMDFMWRMIFSSFSKTYGSLGSG